jgi:hypothetical protein
MDEKLEELAQYITRTLPQSKAINHLQKDVKAGVVKFDWNSQKFMVKPSLEVLELRGANLYITAASMLMQAALMTYDKNSKVLTVLDATIGQAEEFFVNHQTEKAFEVLKTVKQTMGRIIGGAAARKWARS